MINNSTNINKTNNHLLPQTIEHKKNTTIYDTGNPENTCYHMYARHFLVINM
jgi:hypothetical protein